MQDGTSALLKDVAEVFHDGIRHPRLSFCDNWLCDAEVDRVSVARPSSQWRRADKSQCDSPQSHFDHCCGKPHAAKVDRNIRR